MKHIVLKCRNNHNLRIGADTFNKLFIVLILLFPIISIYWGGVSSLTIADVFLLFFALFYALKGSYRHYDGIWLSYLIYIVIHCLITSIFYTDTNVVDNFIFLRYLLYIFTLTFLIPKHFNLELGLHYLKQIGKFTSIFCILQATSLYILGFYIKGYIPFLPIMNEALTKYGNNIASTFRIRGFLAEPAHLAEYMTLILIVFLFTEGKHNKIWAVLASISVLFSISKTGLIMLVFLWCVYFYFDMFRKHPLILKDYIKFILLIMVVLVIVLIFLKSSLYEYTERTFDFAYRGRMNGYDAIKNLWHNNNNLQMLLGHSYVRDTSVYLSSYPVIFWRYGITGLLVFCIIFIRLYYRCDLHYQKIICFALLILFVGTELFISPRILPHLAFVTLFQHKCQSEATIVFPIVD